MLSPLPSFLIYYRKLNTYKIWIKDNIITIRIKNNGLYLFLFIFYF